MIITCLFIAHALGVQTQEAIDVSIHHRRASQVLEILERSDSIKQLAISADDSKGCLIVQGSPETVKGVRELVKMLDVARKKLSVRVTVDSDADKESYQVTTKIYDRQKWTTGDGDTGIHVSVEPRLNPDHTVTLLVNCERRGSSTLSEVFRMKLGTSHSIGMGGHQAQSVSQETNGKFKMNTASVPDPKVTIRIDG